jgi:hypothetical protein
MDSEVTIALAKFKAIQRAKEAVQKRERDLDRLIARMSKEDRELFTIMIQEINQA